MPILPRVSSLFLFSVFVLAFSFQGSAATVDGKPNFTAGASAAMYVWRDTSNNSYYIRLASGGTAQNATGSLASSKPINWMGAVALESNDSLTKPSTTQVSFKLNTTAADFLDGVDISVPAGGTLCLSVSGSLGAKVYLGVNKTPATGPVDLLGNGGCGSATAASSTVGKLKYHPGHYIALNDWDTQADMINAVKPGVRGMHKRYTWKELEPTLGSYDFSQIASDLQIAADHGMQLIVMIEDKTFDDTKATPSYLWGANTLWHLPSGWVAKRWAPYVVTRLTALCQALGKRFDGNPNFEGIAFQESSMGLSAAAETANGYTPEKYRDALISILKATRAAMPTSQVFWYMNFLEGNNTYLGQIADAIVPLKIAMGGPDVLPDNVSLNTFAYPYYKKYHSTMTLFASLQYGSYGALHVDKSYPTKYWTMPEMFWFAKSNLYVNYLFWNRKVTADPADSYNWTNALPVIKNNPDSINPSPFGW